MASSDLANLVYQALKPEVKVTWSKSRVQIKTEKNILVLYFSSYTISTLRALLNSYLRWIIMIENMITVLNHIS